MARVLLVNTNLMQPPIAPIGLDYIASALDAAGHAVELLDLCLEQNWRQALRARLTAAPPPHLIAATLRNTDDCYCASRQTFLPQFEEMIEALREQSEAPVVIGGVGFSLMPRAILERLPGCVGIIGDGEQALPQMATRIERAEDVTGVPGYAGFREGWRAEPPAHGPVDDLPTSRAWVDNARYFREGGQGGIETKRGCAGRCIYCADPVAKGRKYRLRPPPQVAAEAESLLAQGVDCLHTCDSEFNLPPGHALAVCEEFIRRGLGERLRWYAYCSPEAMTAELARAMRRAGCVGINFGTDSGAEVMLRRLGRDFTAAQVGQALRACREAGITTMCDLLLGGPGETPDTADETIRVMQRLAPDAVGVAVGLRVYPGTELARIVAAQGAAPDNPNLVGHTTANPDFAQPLFYLSAALGPDYVRRLHAELRDDPRFLLGGSGDETDYNYSANDPLVRAIRAGARGAYWDTLRRLRVGDASAGRGRDFS